LVEVVFKLKKAGLVLRNLIDVIIGGADKGIKSGHLVPDSRRKDETGIVEGGGSGTENGLGLHVGKVRKVGKVGKAPIVGIFPTFPTSTTFINYIFCYDLS
jgi:hypothetical protein